MDLTLSLLGTRWAGRHREWRIRGLRGRSSDYKQSPCGIRCIYGVPGEGDNHSGVSEQLNVSRIGDVAAWQPRLLVTTVLLTTRIQRLDLIFTIFFSKINDSLVHSLIVCGCFAVLMVNDEGYNPFTTS